MATFSITNSVVPCITDGMPETYIASNYQYTTIHEQSTKAVIRACVVTENTYKLDVCDIGHNACAYFIAIHWKVLCTCIGQ